MNVKDCIISLIDFVVLAVMTEEYFTDCGKMMEEGFLQTELENLVHAKKILDVGLEKIINEIKDIFNLFEKEQMSKSQNSNNQVLLLKVL